MNGAKQKSLNMNADQRGDTFAFLRLTILLNGWDQVFLSQLAAAEGVSTPAFVGDLIRAKLHQAREAAKI